MPPLRTLDVQAPPVMIGSVQTKVNLSRFMRSDAPIYAATIDGIGYLEEDEIRSLAEMVETADAQSKAKPQTFYIGEFHLEPVATVNLHKGNLKVTGDSQGSAITIRLREIDSYQLPRASVDSFGKAMGEILKYIETWQKAMGEE